MFIRTLQDLSVKLTIIIVNWNTGKLLEECLSSFLLADLQISYELILVDNASSDGSLDAARVRFPFVQVIENHENVGFARANNQGIGVARGEYVLLLNPDTLIPDITIFKKWISFMDRHLETGASGCRLIFPDGKHQVGDAGFRPSLASAFNFAFFLSRFFPDRRKGLFLGSERINSDIEVDWVCGADVLVRRDILPTTGLLDETVFMYAEDVEWGCRIKSMGYKVCYLPYLKIVHLQGMSYDKLSGKRPIQFLWLENLRHLYKRYNEKQPLLYFDLVLLIGYLLRAMIYFVMSLKEGWKHSGSTKKARQMFQYALYLFKSQFRRAIE